MPSHTKSERKKNKRKLIGPGAKSDLERKIARKKRSTDTRGGVLFGKGDVRDLANALAGKPSPKRKKKRATKKR